MKAKKRKASKGKTTAATVHGIKIREVRPGCFLVRVRRAGLNHSETFTSLEAARLKCEQLHAEQVNNGLSAFEIDGRTRQDAKEAVKILSGRCSLANAARLWIKHNPDGGAVTVSELVGMHLAEMERRKLRAQTIADARIRMTKFAADYGERPAVTITGDHISEWLEVRGGAARNQINNRARLHALFAYAVKRSIIEINPVAKVERQSTDATMPEIWPPERVEAVLRAAQTFNPNMTPYLAVCAFAGLRPSEAQRLNWKDVHLSERIIRIMPGTSKVRQARIVEISDNLAAWLAPHRQDRGPIAPAQMSINRWRVKLSGAAVIGVDKVQKRFAKQDGLKGTQIKKQRLGWDAVIQDARKVESDLWPIDVLRHSCATAWLAAHSDIHKLAEMLGNSAQVIKAHYKGMMTSKEAARYWSMMPDKKSGKVIAMSKTA